MPRLRPLAFAPALLAVALVARHPVTHAADDAPQASPASVVAEAAAAWWAEDDPQARGVSALRILTSGASAADVAQALETGRVWPSAVPKGTVHTWKRPGPGGHEHTCYLLIPRTYDPATPMRLLVWLHGGVARDEDGGGASGLRLWGEQAAEEGFLLLCPSGRTGAEWWSPGGVGVLKGALADVRRHYNVDGERIACAGFSDGASGCYHLLLHQPEPFCCFLALMGQPLVSRLLGGPSAAANAGSRPVWAVHGETDSLYPARTMKPLMDELRAAGADLTWKELPDTGHDFSALNGQWDEMRAFWEAHPRTPRKAVRWQSSVPWLSGRCDWVEVFETARDAPAAEGLGTTLLTVPAPTPRPRLGVRLDTTFEGPGVRLEDVEAESAASTAGMRTGDVLVEVEGETLRTAQDLAKLRDALDRLAAEERDGTFVLERDGERIEVQARPRIMAADLVPPTPQGPGVGDPPGVIEARIAAPNRIELRTAGVRRVRLHLGPEQVDLAEPVTVVINGTVRFEGTLPGNAAYVLSEAWRDGGIPRYRMPLVLLP
jgi:membrane-associated protease RseP (regulator of RpoE activity)